MREMDRLDVLERAYEFNDNERELFRKVREACEIVAFKDSASVTVRAKIADRELKLTVSGGTGGVQ